MGGGLLGEKKGVEVRVWARRGRRRRRRGAGVRDGRGRKCMLG